MVLRRTAVLVLLLAFLPTPASAQEGPEQLLQEGTGDVQLVLGGTQPVPDSGVYTCADLVGLSIVEARGDLTFTVTVDDLKDSSQDPAADGCRYDVFFTHNGREFQLRMFRTLPSLDGTPFAVLQYRDAPEAPWDGAWSTESDARFDLAADTYSVTVPRDVLADASGAAPYPSRSLEAIHAIGYSGFGGAQVFADSEPFPEVAWPVYAQDAMPNDAAQAASFPIQLGMAQTGNARLASTMPFRASNGEATTFVYNVTASNIGESEGTFELAATGVPTGYALVLPVPLVKLDAGESASVPVLLTMPFGHQHGSLASFVLELRSLSDANSIGRLEMGVRFLTVPQPAGHHDTVYLHAAEVDSLVGLQFRDGFFNTLEDDPNDAGGNLYNGGFSMYGVGEWAAFWSFPLSPALEMGLDVDPGKTGYLRIPIGTTLPMLQASLTARLYIAEGDLFFGEEVADLALAGPSDPVDISANSQALIEVPFVAEDAVRTPFEPGRTLWISIDLRFHGPNSFGLAQESVYVAPGGSAQLPLREWHDAVDEALAVQGGPALSALGAQERLVNPGEAVVFPVSVANPLDDDVTVAIEVSGARAEWASLPADQLRVPAHGTAQVSVVVRAPAAAVDQERADLVLQAYAKDRPEVRGLLRLVAEVDTAADQVDDTAVATDLERKESPAPGTMLVVLGLAGLAGLLRRRT